MAESKGRKAPTAGAAARAEVSEKPKPKAKKPKAFTFRKVKLEAPPELPGTFGFDVGDFQVRLEEEDEIGAAASAHRLVESLLGREQLQKVRGTIKGMGDPWQIELLNKILEVHGTDLGKAEASAQS